MAFDPYYGTAITEVPGQPGVFKKADGSLISYDDNGAEVPAKVSADPKRYQNWSAGPTPSPTDPKPGGGFNESGSVTDPANPRAGSLKGNGWDQWAKDQKGFGYGLKTALARGLKGDQAIEWMDANGWKGAKNPAGGGIQYYGDSDQFGLPDGTKVVPGADGGYDIYMGSSRSKSPSAGGLFGATPSTMFGNIPFGFGLPQSAMGGLVPSQLFGGHGATYPDQYTPENGGGFAGLPPSGHADAAPLDLDPQANLKKLIASLMGQG